MVSVKIAGEELTLLPQKAIWWESRRALLLADLHLGKSGHFRKAGFAVPAALQYGDLDTLSELVGQLDPLVIYILGDFFHSDLNTDWLQFSGWRRLYPALKIILVRGNHDILKDTVLQEAGITIVEGYLDVGPFRLVHIPPGPDSVGAREPVSAGVSGNPAGAGLAESAEPGPYYLSGHLHPGIRMSGKARQSLVMPCFYFGATQGILPAFGRFTGNSALSPVEGDQIFPVYPGKVICL